MWRLSWASLYETRGGSLGALGFIPILILGIWLYGRTHSNAVIAASVIAAMATEVALLLLADKIRRRSRSAVK